MTALRRLAYSTLGLAYALIVFGAIVRISGSGMGCGDHWPRCFGSWFPPLDQPTLVIEWTHRLLAAITVVMVVSLVLLAYSKRARARRGGARWRAARGTLAAGLVCFQALLGMVTVRMGNTAWATVAHLLNGALLLAALAATVLRAGGLGGTIAHARHCLPHARRARRVRGSGDRTRDGALRRAHREDPGCKQCLRGFPLCRGIC